MRRAKVAVVIGAAQPERPKVLHDPGIARPDALLDIKDGADHMTLCVLMSAAMLRRAFIVGATMLSIGLGA